MTTERHENSVEFNKNISAIITFTGDDCGLAGPRIAIQYTDYTKELQEFPERQVGDFLNDNTAPEKRTISEDLENAIFDKFSYCLKKEGEKYSYTGHKYSEPLSLFPRSYDETQKKNLEAQNLLQEANQSPLVKNVGKFNSDCARAVLQREVGITSADADHFILGTYGLGPCVGLAVYNPEMKQALLAHLDEFTDLNSLKRQLFQISQGSHQCEVHLKGGNNSSRELVTEILKLLKNNNMKIKSAKLVNEEVELLAIDAKTGEVYTDFNYKQLMHEPGYENKLRALQFSIQKSSIDLCFDGRKQDQDKKFKSLEK